jgi:hypothetical protein
VNGQQIISGNSSAEPRGVNAMDDIDETIETIDQEESEEIEMKNDEIIPENEDEGEKYIIERIISHKGHKSQKNKMKFKVRWQGYGPSEDTFEKYKDLKDNLRLYEYLKKKKMDSLIPKEYRDEEEEKEIQSEERGENSKETVSKRKMRQKAKEVGYSAQEFMHILNENLNQRGVTIEEGNIASKDFADWTTHKCDEEEFYLDYAINSFYVIDNDQEVQIEAEEGYKAVRDNVPRRFDKALADPDWGEAARTELDTIFNLTKCVIKVDQEIAKQLIKDGANCLRLIPVYEEKEKEGKLVRKVRLVADGRYHAIYGKTFLSNAKKRRICYIVTYYSK